MKFLIIILFFSSAGAIAQQDTMKPAYQRYPEIPGLQLLLSDSTKYTNENLPKESNCCWYSSAPTATIASTKPNRLLHGKKTFATHTLSWLPRFLLSV